MSMTIRQILSKTPRSRRTAAEWVTLKTVKVKKSKDGFPMVLAKTIAKYNNLGVRKTPPPRHSYVTTIEVRGKNCIVSCSCDDFWAVWEYALAQRDAAKIEYSNGKHPKEKNPQLLPGCCKHIYKLATTLIEQGKL
jgi:hypothetical protein